MRTRDSAPLLGSTLLTLLSTWSTPASIATKGGMLLLSIVDEWSLPEENVDLGESQSVELPHIATVALIRQQSA